jgi:hypothetical protein
MVAVVDIWKYDPYSFHINQDPDDLIIIATLLKEQGLTDAQYAPE